MATSTATTVEAYLDELPEDRRHMISTVRTILLENLPKGYVERMAGMINYEIPLERYPETYNKQPLMYMALASQKNHCALYMMSVYQDEALKRKLEAAFAEAGLKMNMGKSCLRFKKLDGLPLDTIGEIVAAVSVDQFIANYEAVKKK